MTGRVIEDDMFGVARRLKEIDSGYFVFLNYKTGKFEVHNSRSSPTLCLVLPFDKLDERTVNRVRYTRAERAEAIIAEMDRQNAEREARARKAAVERALSATE